MPLNSPLPRLFSASLCRGSNNSVSQARASKASVLSKTGKSISSLFSNNRVLARASSTTPSSSSRSSLPRKTSSAPRNRLRTTSSHASSKLPATSASRNSKVPLT